MYYAVPSAYDPRTVQYFKEKQMGRPIKKKYFGNLNTGGVGGEGVASVTLSTSSLTVSTGTVSVVFGAPNLAGGVQAVGSAVKTGNTVTSVTITTAGSGYTSAPAVVFNASVGTTGTGVAVLTSSDTNNALAVYANVAGGGALVGDIVKQEASRRYLVKTSAGTKPCKLVAKANGSLSSGEMNLVATDVDAATYYVTKLTARRARLTPITTGTTEFSLNEQARWTLGAATTGTVSIASN